MHVLQGCTATICMPVTTPDIKVDAVRRLGGAVELVGESYSETQAHAQARLPRACSSGPAAEHRLHFVWGGLLKLHGPLPMPFKQWPSQSGETFLSQICQQSLQQSKCPGKGVQMG